MTIEGQSGQTMPQRKLRLVNAVVALQARFARWRLYRQAAAELAELSNRELADLGLHRSELKRITYMAVYES